MSILLEIFLGFQNSCFFWEKKLIELLLLASSLTPRVVLPLVVSTQTVIDIPFERSHFYDIVFSMLPKPDIMSPYSKENIWKSSNTKFNLD